MRQISGLQKIEELAARWRDGSAFADRLVNGLPSVNRQDDQLEAQLETVGQAVSNQSSN